MNIRKLFSGDGIFAITLLSPCAVTSLYINTLQVRLQSVTDDRYILFLLLCSNINRDERCNIRLHKLLFLYDYYLFGRCAATTLLFRDEVLRIIQCNHIKFICSFMYPLKLSLYISFKFIPLYTLPAHTPSYIYESLPPTASPARRR